MEKTINALFNENFLALETMSDPHLREVRDCVESKDWERLKQFDPVYHRIRDSLANMNGVLVYDEKIVIPKKLRPKFVQLLHAAHPGQLGMTAASEYMWWPGKNKQLIQKCKSCIPCQELQTSGASQYK